MHPAKESLYTREIREKFEVGFFLFMKKCENVTLLGERAFIQTRLS